MDNTQSNNKIMASLLGYLKLKNVPIKKSGPVIMFKCPFCEKVPISANIIPNTNIANCFVCSKKYNIIDIARKIDFQGESTPDEEVLHFIKEALNLDVKTSIDKENIQKHLDFYVQNKFDLVPITKNSKIPCEKNWTNKGHKDKDEWNRWLKSGLNVGVKTGQCSDITIIDIDQKPIPQEIKDRMGDTLMQESSKGYHLIYKYDADLPKTRIDDLKVDIENNGGQVVIYPSVIDKIQRKMDSLDEIKEMPAEFKKFLLSKVTVPRKTNSEVIREDIETESFNLGLLGEGQRNSSLIKLGGIMRKQLNLNQTSFVLKVLNKHLCDYPLSNTEVNAMVNSLDKYSHFDEQELAHRIIEYMKDIEESNRQEISNTIAGTNRGEEAKRVGHALEYLVKEGYLIKAGHKYSIVRKANWKEELIQIGNPVEFQVPYFNRVANFNYGDMILIGSRNKHGKSHIALNIVKDLVKQGKKPYYITSEPGNRFSKIALSLGLKEGDFKWDWMIDPTQIELEKDAVTIIDWLCPKDFAKTDKLFMHFVEQLYKTNGLLIVFMQLKDDNSWFASNMVKQYPAFAARYIYDNADDGEYGHFQIDAMRDPKIKTKVHQVPCRYDWETKTLTPVEILEEEKEKE